MSRITKKNNKYELAFGRDHVFGLFLQIFRRTLVTEDPIEDLNDIDSEKLIETAKHYGFTITKEDIQRL